MPSLKEALNQDLSAYTSVGKASLQASLPPTQMLDPGLNTMIRCPLPPIYQVSTDNLRQFYQGGQVPQFRILTPSLQTSSGGATGGNVVAGPTTNGGGGGGGGSTPSQPTAQSVSITSSLLTPNSTFINSLTLSKSFQLLGVTTSSPARVQLYGTALAQSSDAYRGLDVPTPAGTVQNIICDVALDTAPFGWSFQDRVGANANSPQTSTIYVTLTNLDVTSDIITLTVSYVPLES